MTSCHWHVSHHLHPRKFLSLSLKYKGEPFVLQLVCDEHPKITSSVAARCISGLILNHCGWDGRSSCWVHSLPDRSCCCRCDWIGPDGGAEQSEERWGRGEASWVMSSWCDFTAEDFQLVFFISLFLSSNLHLNATVVTVVTTKHFVSKEVSTWHHIITLRVMYINNHEIKTAHILLVPEHLFTLIPDLFSCRTRWESSRLLMCGIEFLRNKS